MLLVMLPLDMFGTSVCPIAAVEVFPVPVFPVLAESLFGAVVVTGFPFAVLVESLFGAVK